jgi:hypothetical protein
LRQLDSTRVRLELSSVGFNGDTVYALELIDVSGEHSWIRTFGGGPGDEYIARTDRFSAIEQLALNVKRPPCNRV